MRRSSPLSRLRERGWGEGVFETLVPSSPALLGAIVYDCHSLEARDREKGAREDGHARSTKSLSVPAAPHGEHSETVGPITIHFPWIETPQSEMASTV